MLIKKYKAIMEREEEHRGKWATGLTFGVFVLIFMSFAFYKGFFSFGNSQTQVANVISVEKAPSPIQNTEETFGAAFSEIGKQYQSFKDSLSGVLVPFVTGIDVYERK
jgi:hypothetical protein